MKKILIGLMVMFLSLQAEEVYTTFKVHADQKADLAFDASGAVNKVYVEVSSVVKKGDVLAELHNDDLKASLQIAKAALNDAKVSLKFAKRDYDRQVKVKHLIDESKFDVYALAYERADVRFKQATAQLAYQQALLNKTKLRAPFDGIIFDKSVEIGDVVSGMMLRTVFKVQSLNKRKLIIAFDQKYWKRIKLGQKYKYSVDGDKQVYEGVISKIHPAVNEDNRKINAEIKSEKFVVGLFGEGYIAIPDTK